MWTPISDRYCKFFRCTGESGLYRGTRISGRFSFSATEAARWIRFSVSPVAIDAAVDVLQGITTIASARAEPLDTRAVKSSLAETVSRLPARYRFGSGSDPSSCLQTARPPGLQTPSAR